MMTGYDILFFWVARMIMLGMRFAGDVPFPVVFLNGLVRDEHGEKMSKTRGNDVDPLELVSRHGTDAVRFTMTALGAPGTNPALSEQRLVGYRAFVNKLWNASRFLLMNLEGERAPGYEFAKLPLPSRWILSRQQDVARKVGESLAEFRFDQAANELYHFVWDEFCDWYIEIAKSYFADPVEGPRTRAVLLEVLEKTLRLLHPVMPFVTEEIWQRLPHEGPSIMVAPYPRPEPGKSRRRRRGGHGARDAPGHRHPHAARHLRGGPQAADRRHGGRAAAGGRARSCASTPRWCGTWPAWAPSTWWPRRRRRRARCAARGRRGAARLDGRPLRRGRGEGAPHQGAGQDRRRGRLAAAASSRTRSSSSGRSRRWWRRPASA